MPANFPLMLAQDNLFSQAEVDKLVAAANSDEVKGLLKSDSQKLVEEGAFGFVRRLSLLPPPPPLALS